MTMLLTEWAALYFLITGIVGLIKSLCAKDTLFFVFFIKFFLSLIRLYEDMMKNTLNLEVQLLLKQGQVEVPCGQFIPDYSDSILIHRGVVEDLNGTIRVSGVGC